MKTKLFLLGMLALIGLSTNAQWKFTGGPNSGGAIDCLDTTGTNLFCGSFGSGVFIYDGTNWTRIVTGLTSTQVVSMTVGGTDIIAGTWGGAFISNNNGGNWDSIDNGLTSQEISALTFDGTILYAGTFGSPTGGVFKSANNGSSWTSLINLGSEGVYSLNISGNNILAGVNLGVELSTDGGNTWTNVFISIGNTYSLARNGSNIFAGTDSGSCVSSNNGSSWTVVNSGLPHNNPIDAFAIVGSNVFAGSDSGVFVTNNNGGHWTAVNTGLPMGPVYSLAVYDSDLYAGVGSEVWERPLSQMVLGVNEIVKNMTIIIYPNPSKDFFIIESGTVISSIEILNLLGEEVSFLKVNSEKTEINLSNQPKGIYIYKITTEEGNISTGKLVVE